MKRPANRLRTQALDLGALEKVNGARGTACGNMWHCDACGHASAIADWQSDGNACPICDCPKGMTATAWKNDGRFR